MSRRAAITVVLAVLVNLAIFFGLLWLAVFCAWRDAATGPGLRAQPYKVGFFLAMCGLPVQLGLNVVLLIITSHLRAAKLVPPSRYCYCGYPRAGIPPRADCPECGAPAPSWTSES